MPSASTSKDISELSKHLFRKNLQMAIQQIRRQVSTSSSEAFTFSGKNKTSESAARDSMLLGSGKVQNTLQSVTTVLGANTASATFSASVGPIKNIDKN